MIYVFLADGFEEVEALATVDVLRRAGATVQTVGVGGKHITSSHNITVTADITENQVTDESLEAIVLPGGMPGTLNLEKSTTVQSFINICIERDLYICAICAAPSILGHRDLLAGKRVTCFPSFEKDLYGTTSTQGYAEADGKIITGKGAGAAVEFALLIVKEMFGEDTSDKVRKSMQCPQVI